MKCGCKDTCKGHIGELLRVRILSTCATCNMIFQINKELGIVDYVCPRCGIDNKEETISEHVHAWEWFKYDGHYHCQVGGCDEKRHPLKMEGNVNATEALSAERADAIVGALRGEYETEDVDIEAMQAYANARGDP